MNDGKLPWNIHSTITRKGRELLYFHFPPNCTEFIIFIYNLDDDHILFSRVNAFNLYFYQINWMLCWEYWYRFHAILSQKSINGIFFISLGDDIKNLTLKEQNFLMTFPLLHRITHVPVGCRNIIIAFTILSSKEMKTK